MTIILVSSLSLSLSLSLSRARALLLSLSLCVCARARVCESVSHDAALVLTRVVSTCACEVLVHYM